VKKILSLAVTLLALIALSGLASAQTKDITCKTHLSGGTGNSAFDYCVSPNGNIVQMETPSGFQHLISNHKSEGYGLCDVTGGNVAYYDYGDGGVSSTHVWLSPLPINGSISRTTNDTNWELVQTFTGDPKNSAVKVKMELINHSTENRKVKLVRFADVKVNGGASGNGVSDVFMATLFSAATSDGVVPSSISPGIELRDATNGKPTPYVQKVQVGPNPCSPTANVDLTKAFLFTPGSLELVYDLGGNDIVVPANGKKTFTALYRPF